MSLIVEDGTAVQNAESYVTVAYADTYWSKRQHDATLYTRWNTGTTELKEGALREASAYLDAVYGANYKGTRRGYVQGLLWPRRGALDSGGYPLPDLPEELKKATCELAVRSYSARLSPDSERENQIKREKKVIGPITKEVEYVDGASTETRYGVVEGMMATLIENGQSGSWLWE